VLNLSGPTWIDRPGRAWAELPAVIETIRTDAGVWLGAPVRRDLCTWLLTAVPAPTVAEAAGIPGNASARQPR
jgi:hypothetical protein